MNEADIVSQLHSCTRTRTMCYGLRQNFKSIKNRDLFPKQHILPFRFKPLVHGNTFCCVTVLFSFSSSLSSMISSLADPIALRSSSEQLKRKTFLIIRTKAFACNSEKGSHKEIYMYSVA